MAGCRFLPSPGFPLMDSSESRCHRENGCGAFRLGAIGVSNLGHLEHRWLAENGKGIEKLEERSRAWTDIAQKKISVEDHGEKSYGEKNEGKTRLGE